MEWRLTKNSVGGCIIILCIDIKSVDTDCRPSAGSYESYWLFPVNCIGDISKKRILISNPEILSSIDFQSVVDTRHSNVTSIHSTPSRWSIQFRRSLEGFSFSFQTTHESNLTESIPKYRRKRKCWPVHRSASVLFYSMGVYYGWAASALWPGSAVGLCNRSNRAAQVYLLKGAKGEGKKM